jgi:hypothetical protein
MIREKNIRNFSISFGVNEEKLNVSQEHIADDIKITLTQDCGQKEQVLYVFEDDIETFIHCLSKAKELLKSSGF